MVFFLKVFLFLKVNIYLSKVNDKKTQWIRAEIQSQILFYEAREGYINDNIFLFNSFYLNITIASGLLFWKSSLSLNAIFLNIVKFLPNIHNYIEENILFC